MDTQKPNILIGFLTFLAASLSMNKRGIGVGSIKRWLLPGFLILFGVVGLGFGSALPQWIVPTLALIAGVLALWRG